MAMRYGKTSQFTGCCRCNYTIKFGSKEILHVMVGDTRCMPAEAFLLAIFHLYSSSIYYFVVHLPLFLVSVFLFGISEGVGW